MGRNTKKRTQTWWKEAVVYEIYPASFKDSNDDGIGDIPGIVSKLDYLRDLGVDVIHICPHYQSPQVDMGYDISNYEEIHEPYGTVEDVQTLIDAAHGLGMKIIFDLVINHSSNMHKWFQESRSSKSSPKRDWYFWRPPKIDADGNRHPPNNWRSHFTVPAWTWDEVTQEYYLHIYAPEMPDFNWENKQTREAIYNTSITFWLKRGIDGFRIDTVNKYSKNVSFPDAEITNPKEETQPAWRHYNHGPRIHEFLGEMKDIFDQYSALTVGELSSFPRTKEGVMEFVSSRTGPLNMVFNFDISDLGQKRKPGQKGPVPFDVQPFKQEMSRWQTFASDPEGWITLYLENHDAPRSLSRFGRDFSLEDQTRVGKMLAMIMATMTGTLFLYQGQEIGMSNLPRSWPIDEYKDIRSVNMYKRAQQTCAGKPECLARARDDLWKTARDHARLPMQWNMGPNSGFTSEGVTPWMRVHDDWEQHNVELQLGNSSSLLEFWKRILKLRKEYKELFIYGAYKLVESQEEDLFIFVKEGPERKSLTVVNFSNSPKKWEGPSDILGVGSRLLLGTTGGKEGDVLNAWEGRVYLKSS
ncbi:glycoside hydrolase [Mollisia scopiformis]|uniref:Glycoside hydrolase n=1 Tax=Mollisia scopiformis TaxID=149040 RepID=A0A194XW69_MOLSC|nr:glycoside hydrolase [Mollisia scopiformis]KUJ24483.1 glycoside hydrolase [Mollisia scopiformis]